MIDPIQNLRMEDPKIELRFHTTPESIFNEFWNSEKDRTFEDLLASTLGGVTGKDDDSDETMRKLFDRMVETKYWVFGDANQRMIHIWLAAGEDIETDLLRLHIGYEVGLILEEKELSENVFVADEQRAGNYGMACCLTEKFLGRILFERS